MARSIIRRWQAARPTFQLLLGIPTANHPLFAALRIKSMGLMQMSGGRGESTSSILKSPLGDSKTPAGDEILSVKGALGSQIRVAKTEVPAGARPALFPPPRINPFPSTWMRPFALTVASSWSITQIWPAGCTLRTIFRFTLSTTSAVGCVGGTATPDETGITPIPPLNVNSAAAAGSETTTPRNTVHANAFFIMALLPTTAFFRKYLTDLAPNARLVKEGADASVSSYDEMSTVGSLGQFPTDGLSAAPPMSLRRDEKRRSRERAPCVRRRFKCRHSHQSDISQGAVGNPPARGTLPRAAIARAASERRGHHLDPRHHAPVLVLEDMAVVDKFPELRERDVEDLSGRLTTTTAPLSDGADIVLVVGDIIRDSGIGHRHAEGEIVLHHSAVACLHHESRLVKVEIVIFGRQLNDFPGLMHRCLAGPEREADGGHRRIELRELVRGRFLRAGDRTPAAGRSDRPIRSGG